MQQQLNDITIKFFKYFDFRFRGLDQRFSAQSRHIDGLYKIVDLYIKQAELCQQEVAAGDARVARLECQIYKLANKVGSRVTRG